jgi:hypothetical protein
MNLVTLLSFFPFLLATENLQNHFFFFISHFGDISPGEKKKDWCQHRLLPASAAAPAVRELNCGGGYGVVVVQCWRHQEF